MIGNGMVRGPMDTIVGDRSRFFLFSIQPFLFTQLRPSSLNIGLFLTQISPEADNLPTHYLRPHNRALTKLIPSANLDALLLQFLDSLQ